jgi:hypothetical protein
MTTINFPLITKFTLIEFMLDKTDEMKKLRDLRKFKPNLPQVLSNETKFNVKTFLLR